jgi:hypothetical protein
MDVPNNKLSHENIVSEIYKISQDLGFEAYREYRGSGWRAEIFVQKENENIAFEVQLSPQTHKKTLERQEKYLKDGVKCCWLILPTGKRRPTNLKKFRERYQERKDLPRFNINIEENLYKVSLIDGRKEALLSEFIKAFLMDEIKHCKVVRTGFRQKVKIYFFDWECWKCKAANHVYYIDRSYSSMCNFELWELEAMWSDERHHFKPEIVSAVKEILESDKGKNLKVGEIKPRFSNTARDSYLSFGCYKCDSIYGDWFYNTDQLYARNNEDKLKSFEVEVKPQKQLTKTLSHWCYPENGEFCDLK